MNWLIHPIPNLIIAILLYESKIVTSIPLLTLFILFSILLDIDHAIYFLLKYPKKSISRLIKKSKEYRKSMRPGFYIFHSPEILLLILILSPINQVISLLLLSNLIHIYLDIFEHYRHHKNFKFIKHWSIIYNISK